jgi:hypothetical protein
MSFREKLKRLKSQLQQEKSSLDFAQWESGKKYLVRILPLNPSTDDFYLRVKFHYQVGEKTLICPGKDCPICEVARTLEATGEPEKMRVGKSLRPITRYLMKVLVRGQGLRIWNCPSGLFERTIAEYFLDEDYDALHDLAKGRDFIVKRTGTGLETTYAVMVSAKVTPAFTSPEEKELWKKSPNLEERFAPTSIDTLLELAESLEILVSEEPEEVEEEENTETHKHKPDKKKPTGKKEVKEEPEEQEEIEEEPEEEPEEVEEPEEESEEVEEPEEESEEEQETEENTSEKRAQDLRKKLSNLLNKAKR